MVAYGETARQNIKAQALKYKNAYDEDQSSTAGQFYITNKECFDEIIANSKE